APLTPWTEMAPTGSSILILSKKKTDSTTKRPASKPRTDAPTELTKAHGQVMATRPANMPLQHMLGSGLRLRNHIQTMDAKHPVPESSIVFVAPTAIRRSVP